MTAARTDLVLVTGLVPGLTAQVATALLDRPGTVAVHHDVSRLDSGVVVRTLRESGPGGITEHTAVIELAHGCLSCTLRLDLLPLLRTLGRRADVSRVVLQLDPALAPEHLCWSIGNVVLDDEPAGAPETAGDHVQVAGVLAVLDAATWFDAATGDQCLADVGLAAAADDERTLAQVAVDQTGFADAVLLAGEPADPWSAVRLHAVLDRLLPGAPRAPLGAVHPDELLTALPRDARRGRVSSPHDPLLAGQPPLDEDAGVGLVRFAADRPFHPERLHEALDVLLDGVVRTRGRLWLATQHDRAVWLESAGGGLRVGDAGPWLDTLGEDPELWAQVDPQRAAAAALRWDPVFGDRDVQLVVLTHRQSPMAITTTLFAALLTDAELAAGPDLWATWPDPFGERHEDPCEASSPADLQLSDREEHP
ncbi:MULTISPECIES: ribosome hibernation factor-recruiting GTPase MRF [unclassified Modestobacter]